ncbi:MAG TPA: suppressor of fused domain protein [Longimicrobium sp.]|nr:suppressor of fused domain protein [Longimicrobium sp.]
MTMRDEEVYPALVQHLQGFFRGHECTLLHAPPGPIQRVLPRLHVMRVAPGPRTRHWVYATVGAWEVDREAGGGTEFFLIVDRQDDEKNVLRLAMTAHYHRGEHLGEQHTFPLGEPWEPGSELDHMLVSLPYTYGPELEICELPGGHVHFLWLLPITKAEREFKAANGLDALEDRFEEGGIEYWNAHRRSMV